jgi:hypothetical protein
LGIVTTQPADGQGSVKDIARFRGVWVCEREIEPTEPSGNLDREDAATPPEDGAGAAAGEVEAEAEENVEDADEEDVDESEEEDVDDEAVHLALFTDRQGTRLANANDTAYFTRHILLPSDFQRVGPRRCKIAVDEGRGRVVLMIHGDHSQIFVFDFAEAGGRL